MSSPTPPSHEKAIVKATLEKHVTLYIGGVHATDEAIVIKTLLGSCIAVCLYDPLRSVGGMNHFMLPHNAGAALADDATRFGVHAMDRLIAAVMKVGGERRRLAAKIFGGAHVLDQMQESQAGVPQQNIQFAQAFMQDEGIPVHGEDLGGYHPREVHFHPTTGRVFVRRVTSPQRCQRLLERERQNEAQVPRFGPVVFFDKE